MNANKWPLHEMEREVFDVPYSLAECEARLERLDAPPPRLHRMLGNTRYPARTKVIKLVKTNPLNEDNLYCVQRVHSSNNGIMHVYAEMNVGLRPAGDSTHVILYNPPRINKAYLWGLMVDSAIMLILVLGAAAMCWSVNDFVPEAFLIAGVGGIILFCSTMLHFSESRAAVHRHVMWALTFGPLSEGSASVNANKWPLHEMEREVFDVPYSLAECEARLERLHEPEPRNSFFIRGNYYFARTNVIKLAKKNPLNQGAMYCLQRVRKIQPATYYSRPYQDVYTEANVALHPELITTKVTLYWPRRMTKAQKRHVIAIILAIPFGVFVFWVILAWFGLGIEIAVLISTVITIVHLAAIYLHFFRQKSKLRRQIMKALSLDPSQKE